MINPTYSALTPLLAFEANLPIASVIEAGNSSPFAVRASEELREGLVSRSPYGERLIIYRTGIRPIGEVEIILSKAPSFQEWRKKVASQGTDPQKLISDLEEKRDAISNHPDRWDGGKLGVSEVVVTDKGIQIATYPTKYSNHDLTRAQDFDDLSCYTNPLTVVGVNETRDGYILLGLNDRQISDQGGKISTVGSGFIDYEHHKSVLTVQETAISEIRGEIWFSAMMQINQFDPDKMRHLGLAFGTNHDTANIYYQPLDIGLKSVGPREFYNKKNRTIGSEHRLFVGVPNNIHLIKRIIETGEIDIPVQERDGIAYLKRKLTDHCIAALTLYLEGRQNDQICPSRKRDDTRLAFRHANEGSRQ